MSQRPHFSMDSPRRDQADRARADRDAAARATGTHAADAALETFWRHVRRGLLAVSALWLLTVPILLWVRRAQEALVQPPAWPAAIVFGLALLGAAALWRSLAVAADDEPLPSSNPLGRWWEAFLRRLESPTLALVVPTPLLAATAAALTFSGGSVVGVVMLWVLVTIAETAAWCRQAGHVFGPRWRSAAAVTDVAGPTTAQEATKLAANVTASSNGEAHAPLADDHRTWDPTPPQLPAETVGGWPAGDVEEEPEAPESTSEPAASSPLEAAAQPTLLAEEEAFFGDVEGILPDDVQQQWTRSRLPDGGEQILATLRAEFEAGQRTASIHLAFCPPLAEMPELEFEQVDGPDARIQQGELFRHGARLDIRLAEPAAEACSVVVEVAVLAAASTEQRR